MRICRKILVSRLILYGESTEQTNFSSDLSYHPIKPYSSINQPITRTTVIECAT